MIYFRNRTNAGLRYPQGLGTLGRIRASTGMSNLCSKTFVNTPFQASADFSVILYQALATGDLDTYRLHGILDVPEALTYGVISVIVVPSLSHASLLKLRNSAVCSQIKQKGSLGDCDWW